jgi:hypothetical protein
MTKPLALIVAFLGVTVAGVIIGYVLFGIDEAPLPQATATPLPLPTEPARLIDTLPECRNPDVQPGELCAPITDTYQECVSANYVPDRVYAVPCRKPNRP